MSREFEAQHGVVSLAHALASGYTIEAIRAKVRSGRWRRIYRGVFVTFTGPMPRSAAIWAGLISCGPGAVVSHHTAAELIGLSDIIRPAVHVSLPDGRRIAARHNVTVHVSRRLEAARHPTRLPPQTRIEHTVFDLLDAAASEAEAFGWLSAACGRRLTTTSRLTAVLDRATQRPMAAGRRVRVDRRCRWLPFGAGAAVPARCRTRAWAAAGQSAEPNGLQRRSDLPRRPVCRLPSGRGNCDGRVAHPNETRFRDLNRDNIAAEHDQTPVHYGWQDVAETPCDIAAQVARVLRRHGWTGSVRRCGPHCHAVEPSFGEFRGP